MNKKRKSIIAQNEISILETFTLSGYEQKVLIEGKNKNLPIMLCLHGGPGSPIPFSVGARGLFPVFTDNFIMVFWDQLGCGINKYVIDNSFTVDKFVDMTVDLVKVLKLKYPQNKLIVFAVSWGSILSTKAVSIIPELIDGVVVYGQILKDLTFNQEVFEALQICNISTKRKNEITEIFLKEKHSKEDLSKIMKFILKHTDGYFNRTEKSMSLRPLILGLLTSPDYKFRDFVAIIKNGYLKNESLLLELMCIDLTETLEMIKIPYHILQGGTDIVTSTKMISGLVERCNNENLSFTIIPNCGHLPNENGMKIIEKECIEISQQ